MNVSTVVTVLYTICCFYHLLSIACIFIHDMGILFYFLKFYPFVSYYSMLFDSLRNFKIGVWLLMLT